MCRDPEGESINEKIGHLPEATKTNDMDSIDSLLEDFERNKHEYDVAKGNPSSASSHRVFVLWLDQRMLLSGP